MLSKKQLEDVISKCNVDGGCNTCCLLETVTDGDGEEHDNCQMEAVDTAQTALAYREVLEHAREAINRVQWISNYNYIKGQHCECCSGTPERGHDDYCLIGKSIETIEKILKDGE